MNPCYVPLYNCAIERFCNIVLFYCNILLYCTVLYYCTLLLYCTMQLYYCTVLLYCSDVLYYITVLLYCITVLYCCRGWREPGNKTLQRDRVFLLVPLKKRVPDQEGRPDGQRRSGAGAGKIFLVLFRIIEQDQELIQNIF